MDVRVSARILEGNKLLVVRHEKPPYAYWVLPGGHVEEGESLETALRRELQEEIGAEPESVCPAFVFETVGSGYHRLEVVFACEGTGDWGRRSELAPRFLSAGQLQGRFRPARLLSYLWMAHPPRSPLPPRGESVFYLGNLMDP